MVLKTTSFRLMRTALLSLELHDLMERSTRFSLELSWEKAVRNLSALTGVLDGNRTHISQRIESLVPADRYVRPAPRLWDTLSFKLTQ